MTKLVLADQHLSPFAALLIAALGVACPPTSPPSPPPNAIDAGSIGDAPAPAPNLDDCQRGCIALAAPAVRCALQGDASDCPSFLRALNDSGKEPVPSTRKPLTCADVAQVQTRADALALGFVCPP